MTVTRASANLAIAWAVLGQASFAVAAVLADEGLALAVGGALAALVLAAVWRVVPGKATFAAAVAMGILAAFVPFTAPMALSVRMALVVGAVGWLGFVELGHLAMRFGEPAGEEERAALQHTRGQLQRVLTLVAILLGVVAVAPVLPRPWLPAFLADSVELAGAWGVLALGLLVVLGLLTITPVRDLWRSRGAGRSPRTGTSKDA